MNKIVLKANNEKELEEKVKKILNLNEDETFLIKELKKPSCFLFFKFQGEYEVCIVKKDKEKPKVVKENKKDKKNYCLDNNEEIKNKVKETKVKEADEIEKKVEKKLNDFIACTELNVSINSVEKKGNIIQVNLIGKDVRYFIGEKGIALNSLEYLVNTIPSLKTYKIRIDSNNYKKKREDSIISLAKKKAEKVLANKGYIKLNPMNARERRIVHEEISKYSNLETQSYGEDPKRYLVIRYKKTKE